MPICFHSYVVLSILLFKNKTKTTKKHLLLKRKGWFCFAIGRKEIHKTSLDHQIVPESKEALLQNPRNKTATLMEVCQRSLRENSKSSQYPSGQKWNSLSNKIVLANNPRYRDKNSRLNTDTTKMTELIITIGGKTHISSRRIPKKWLFTWGDTPP